MKIRRKSPFFRTGQTPKCSLISPALLLSLVKLRSLPRLALSSRPGFQVHGSLLEELPESHGNAMRMNHISSTYRRPVVEGNTSVRGHATSIHPEL